MSSSLASGFFTTEPSGDPTLFGKLYIYIHIHNRWGFPHGTSGKKQNKTKLPANAGDIKKVRLQWLGQKDLLEEGTATHSSILAWGLPWTRSLAGYSPRDRKELDMTEAT